MLYNEMDLHAKENMAKQSEDCLYLNIFGPYAKNDDTRRYPVLVWIHGGSFLAGSGEVSIDTNVAFKNLVFKGVVLVTINYRLGPLGFIAHKGNDGYWKGNYGLWDMAEALSWVNKYIRYFGGDPDTVTIMGESAGGAAVSILALSPVTEKLIHRAIPMSGSAAAGWGVHRGPTPPNWDVNNLVDHLRCKKNFEKEVKEDLHKELGIKADGICSLVSPPFDCSEEVTDPEELLECLRPINFTSDPFRRVLAVELSVSKAVVDGEIIPDVPETLYKNMTRIPILAGIAEHEWGHKGIPFYNFKSQKRIDKEEAENKIRLETLDSYQQNLYEDLSNSTKDLITNISYYRYFKSQTVNESMDVSDFVYQLQMLEADIDFVAPLKREAMAYASAGWPVYLYSWEHIPPGAVVETESKVYNLFGTRKEVTYNKSITYKRAFHGVDHAYIFTEGYSSQMHFNFTREDRKLSRFLCTVLTNFVKYGDPTPKPVKGITWPKYTPESPSHLKFGVPVEVAETDVKWEAANFWNDHVSFLSNYVNLAQEDGSLKPLDDEERIQMNAYRRAWYALWILVAAIGLLLWTIIICLVARKCINERSKPYNNIIVTNNRP